MRPFDWRTRGRRVGLGGFVAVLALVAGAISCTPRPVNDERPLVRIGFTRYLTMGPMFIAQAEGYFDELGINVELIPIRSSAVSIPALSQGRLDVLPGPMSPSLFNAIHRGAPIRLVSDKGSYTLDSCSHKAFVVSNDIASQGAKTLPKRSSFGREPFSEFGVERALARFGFTMDDVEASHIPMSARYDAVRTGRIDGAILNEPFTSRFRLEGGEIWIELNDLLRDHQYSVFAFGPRLLSEDPGLGEKVAVALLRGVRRFNEGATPNNVAVMADALGWEAEMLARACWPPMRHDGLINDQSIEEFQTWALEHGSLDAVIPVEDYWDPRFIEHARRVLDAKP